MPHIAKNLLCIFVSMLYRHTEDTAEVRTPRLSSVEYGNNRPEVRLTYKLALKSVAVFNKYHFGEEHFQFLLTE